MLVTGATGFVGSHLVRELLRRGCDVGVLVRDGSELGRLKGLQARLQVLPGGLMDADLLRRAVQAFAPARVFHLAAHGVNEWDADLRQSMLVNCGGTINLLEACRGLSLAGFVYAGTCFEYAGGEAPCREDAAVAPANAYAVSKAAGWLASQWYARMHHLPVAGVRPFQAYGPGEVPARLIPSVIACALRGRDVLATEGRQVRDFVFVDDVVAGMLQASERREAIGQVFNLGTGVGTPVRAAIERVLAAAERAVPVRLGAKPYRPNEIWHLVADTQRSRDVLGWTARVPLEEGLRKTVAWWQEQDEKAAVDVRV